VATVVLITLAARAGDPWKLASFAVFGAMLIALYSISTLYHSLRGRAKSVLRKLDHCAIYLLIAGTYTPFTLVTLRGPLGWTLFALVWALAAGGIVQELWFARGARVASLVLYLLMGWLCVIAGHELLVRVPAEGLFWLALGGLLYTVGVLFYAWRKLPYGHTIWHLFVLGGSICHYLAVLSLLSGA
ncbi:MAG: hemolysin III family protein, partial [Candidatus Bipolaricaulota bacterium]|nr:hemolysin III family protein [Candidatus Bipolaricaulota bacterium]